MRKPLLLAAIAALALAALPLPAAADSKATVRPSADVVIRSGPGLRYRVVGRLEKGQRYHLVEGTRHANWCLVRNDDGRDGWALGSALVGSAAKLQVSPNEFMRPFLNPIPRAGHSYFDEPFR
jgi:uncharacterized protein YgiM (DUF1202 family)